MAGGLGAPDSGAPEGRQKEEKKNIKKKGIKGKKTKKERGTTTTTTTTTTKGSKVNQHDESHSNTIAKGAKLAGGRTTFFNFAPGRQN